MLSAGYLQEGGRVGKGYIQSGLYMIRTGRFTIMCKMISMIWKTLAYIFINEYLKIGLLWKYM